MANEVPKRVSPAGRWLPLKDGADAAYYELYGEAAAFIREGSPLPPQLAAWIAERLNEIALAVRPSGRAPRIPEGDLAPEGGSVNERVRKAVFPIPRKEGRRPSSAAADAAEAFDLARLRTKTPKARLITAAEISGKSPETIRDHVKRKGRKELN